METQNTGVEQAPMKQKDAIYQFAVEALGGVSSAPEGTALRDLVTKDVRKVIRTKLFEGLKSGSVRLSTPMDDSKLKKYCSSSINHWLRKDKRFN